MEKQERIREGFSMIIVFFLLFLVIYGNYFLQSFLGGVYGLMTYVTTSVSAFLCALFLQGEKIVVLYRQRRFLIFHKEMLILGGVFFLLGFMKFWYVLLFPPGSESVPAAVGAVLAGNADLLLLFMAGSLWADGLDVKGGAEGYKRTFGLKWYLIMLVFIFMADYINSCFFQSSFSGRDSFVYVLYFLNLLKILACALGVRAEIIGDILWSRSAFRFRRGTAVLGLASLLLAAMKLWLSLFLHSTESTVIQAINNSDLWQIAYTFAAGLLFVASFQRRFSAAEEENSVMETVVERTS